MHDLLTESNYGHIMKIKFMTCVLWGLSKKWTTDCVIIELVLFHNVDWKFGLFANFYFWV